MQHGDANAPVKRDAETKEWLAQLEEIGEERGYFQPLGHRHFAVFTDESPTLVVTFETFDSIRNSRGGDEPLAYDFVKENGWSSLTIIADGNTWFRNSAVYGYFDRLVDDGFFEDFDQVIFFGAGMCGYAAAAYSVVSPGATVITMSPQATLDPRVAEWDIRFPSMRRTSFSDRYGYAPDMIDAADRVFVFYDPTEDMDAIHAALFTRPHVSKIRCNLLGNHIDQDFINMGILQPLIDAAGTGNLTENDVFKLYRARRNYAPYLRRFANRLHEDNRTVFCGIACRSILERISAPRIRRLLATVEKELEDQGKELPAVAVKSMA